MAISNEITRLSNAKAALKTKIEGAFSVSIPSTDKLDNYPNYFPSDVDLSYRDVHGNTLIARSTANCYVCRAAGLYKFPVVYGNGIKNGSTNTSAYTRQGSTYTADFVNHLGNTITSPYIENNTNCTPASAALLWQSHTSMITAVSLEQGSDCYYIKFTAASVPELNGVAILAVKNSSGDIMWSWDIWLTTHDLTASTFTNYTGATYDLMAENLCTIWDNSTHCVSAWYQWGRKDIVGFRTSYSWSSQTGGIKTGYDINGNTVEFPNFGSSNDQSSSKTVANSIQKPLYHFTQYNSSLANWNNLSYFNNFWNAAATGSSDVADDQSTAKKTIYDPCPVGFMLPAARAFTGFTSNGGEQSSWSYIRYVSYDSYGVRFKRNTSDTVGSYFPFSMLRERDSGKFCGGSNRMYFWTYGYSSQSQAGSYVTLNDGHTITLYTDNRACGMVIRPCVELT